MPAICIGRRFTEQSHSVEQVYTNWTVTPHTTRAPTPLAERLLLWRLPPFLAIGAAGTWGEGDHVDLCGAALVNTMRQTTYVLNHNAPRAHEWTPMI